VKKRRKKKEPLAVKPKTPWSIQFFIGAGIWAGYITLQMLAGETLGKHHSHDINRAEHALWYLGPLMLGLTGVAFRAFEDKQKAKRTKHRK